MHEEGAVDREAITAAAVRLLAERPDASVAAMASFSGFYCDMPPEVPLAGQQIIRRGRLYERASASSRRAVLEAWRRFRQHGVGTANVRTADGEPATIYFLDTRADFGVILSILVPGEPVEDDLHELGPDRPARSRFGRFWRDDLGRVIRRDRAAEALLGYTDDELVGADPMLFIHPEHQELAFENWIETLASPGVARRWRCRHRRRDGSWLWVEITNTSFLEDPEQRLVLSEMMDISEEMAANERLREREELLQRLAESMPLGIVQVAVTGAVVYTNTRLHRIVGVAHATTLRELFATVVVDDRPRLAAAVDRVVSTGVDVDVDLRIDRHDVAQQRICQLTLRALRDGHGHVSGAAITVEDVTESTELRRELERRATFDPLTGCYNRAATMAELERVLGHRLAPGLGTGVVFIDLDRFKPINDRLGHSAGDAVLLAAAERFRLGVRTQDIVGRLGGDEFLIVCPDLDGPEAALALANRVARHLAEPLTLEVGETVDLGASIGVAWAPNHETTADRLVARADTAMYDAKRRRHGRPILALPAA